MTYLRPKSKEEALDLVEQAIGHTRTLLLSWTDAKRATVETCLTPLLRAVEDARTDTLVLSKGVLTNADGVQVATAPGYCDGCPCTCTDHIQP